MTLSVVEFDTPALQRTNLNTAFFISAYSLCNFLGHGFYLCNNIKYKMCHNFCTGHIFSFFPVNKYRNPANKQKCALTSALSVVVVYLLSLWLRKSTKHAIWPGVPKLLHMTVYVLCTLFESAQKAVELLNPICVPHSPSLF